MNLFKRISEEQEIIAKKDIDYMNKELNSFLGSLEPTVPVKYYRLLIWTIFIYLQ